MDDWRVITNKANTLKDDAIDFLARTLPKDKLALYASNIVEHGQEQIIAFPAALHTLMSNKEDIPRLRATAWHLVQHDLALIIALYALRNAFFNYVHDKDHNPHQPNYLFLLHSAMTIGITLYTWQTQIKTLIHLMVLDASAPAAFNAQKIPLPSSRCVAECDITRKVKGMGREIGILWANDFLINQLSRISYVGYPLAKMARIINHGRYITRVVTPERCERHKAMQQEFVLSLGLLFELSHWLVMQQLIARYVGPLPFPAARALQHLLLLFHVNIAAHMHVPSVAVDQATLPLDIFHYYEAGCRFVLDVFWAGLLVRIPQDFATNAKQGFSWFFQKGIYLLNEEKHSSAVVSRDDWMHYGLQLLLPKMAHSVNNFIADPVVALYWPNISKTIINICDAIEKQKNTMAVTIAQNIPKSMKKLMPQVLFQLYAVPEDMTKIILLLVNDEDFWPFIEALKAWSDRHRIVVESQLIPPNGSGSIGEEPKKAQSQEIPSEPIPTDVARHFNGSIFSNKCARSGDAVYAFKKNGAEANPSTFFTDKARAHDNMKLVDNKKDANELKLKEHNKPLVS